MASRTQQNLFAKHSSPVGTGVKINHKVLYLYKDGTLSVGVTGKKIRPVTLFMAHPPAVRRRLRKELREMGHNELVLATIPARQRRQANVDD